MVLADPNYESPWIEWVLFIVRPLVRACNCSGLGSHTHTHTHTNTHTQLLHLRQQQLCPHASLLEKLGSP